MNNTPTSSTPTTPSASPVDPAAHTTETPRFRRRYTSALLTELDREWARLDRRPSTRRHINNWQSSGQLLLGHPVRSLDDIIELTHRDDGDELVRGLVRLAHTDRLAARIVLQRMLPGVIAKARRWRSYRDASDPVDVAIGAAWLAIANFDLDTRGGPVAPALISDCLWSAFRRNSRRRANSEIITGHEQLDRHSNDAPQLDATTALACTMRAARTAGVPQPDLDFLRALARAGSPGAAAIERGVTPRTIRNHRDRATMRVRRALGDDWGDWHDPHFAAAC